MIFPNTSGAHMKGGTARSPLQGWSRIKKKDTDAQMTGLIWTEAVGHASRFPACTILKKHYFFLKKKKHNISIFY